MTPLQLTIAGLHSFRDERTIDFEQLVRGRLFGIFGPTGSGKSTILDAITLALFGNIERTKGNRIESAITSGLHDCRVAFTFEIAAPDGRRRYTAERSYHVRPSGMNSKVRLIRHDREEPEDPEKGATIAEKGSEMKEKLDEILAISADDFSRAVVLPQGAFAEFLRMSRGERAVMLKRIFGLEELGNRLDSTIKTLVTSLASERREREGRLAVLEQYDDALLAERKNAFEKAEKEAAASAERLKEAEKNFAEGEALYRKVTERDQLRAGAASRSKDRTRLDRLRTELKQAAAAAEAEGVVSAAHDAVERETKASERLAAARLEQKKADDRIAPLLPQMKEAEQNRSEGGIIPRLRTELDLLSRIADLDARIASLQKSIDDRTAKLKEQRESLDRLRSRRASAAEKEKKIQEEESEAGRRLAAVEKELAELSRKREAITSLLTAADALEKITAKFEAQRTSEKSAGDELERLAKEETRRRTAFEETEKKVEEKRRELDEIRKANALTSLIHHLHDGTPCPLCGSDEHPVPHQASPEEDPAPIEKDLQALEAAMREEKKKFDRLRDQVGRAETQRDERAASRKAYEKERAEAEKRLTTVREQSRYDGKTDVETLRGYLGRCEEKIRESEETREKEKKGGEELRRKIEELAASRAEEEKEIARIEAGTTIAVEEIEKEERERTSLRAERTDRLKEAGLAEAGVPEGTAEKRAAGKRDRLKSLEEEADRVEKEYREAQSAQARAIERHDEAAAHHLEVKKESDEALRRRDARLKECGFDSLEAWTEGARPREDRERMREEADRIEERIRRDEEALATLEKELGDATMTAEEMEKVRSEKNDAKSKSDAAREDLGDARRALDDATARNAELKQLLGVAAEKEKEYRTATTLQNLLRGNAFIDFIANDRLKHICRTASTELHALTSGRLHIDVESGAGFHVVDHAGGGVKRPTGSLSGGETFLVSLSLALALSESLQLRGAPLEFFFLDEGFGTLDAELLETVMDALDRIRGESNRTIGVISHVRELHERIPRRLVVTPASETEGSGVRVEVG